jgi:hypothetical protein
MNSKRISNRFQKETKEMIKKEINEIKKTAQDMKESLAMIRKVSKRKKESNRKPRNKKLLKSDKKYSGKLFQQTGTSGRQNFRT